MITYGTELKINVHVEPLDNMSMANYEFECTFYTDANRRVTLKKADMKMEDVDNFIAVIETSNIKKLGRGKLMLEFTAFIPDSDFSDGKRTEKAIINTNITIV